jgi:para-nitrobenzyl esterase
LKVIAFSVAVYGIAVENYLPGQVSFAHHDSGVPAVAEVPAIARTGLADLRGTVEGDVAVWRGVPYAQQPIGERRFAAPAPLSPWTGLRDAIEHGPLPPQSRSMIARDRNDPKIRDEACLTVTV